MNKIELLAPAGSFEKLKLAVGFGADAVYFGGNTFNLRKRSKNFSIEQIERAVDYLHKRDKKGFLTLNFYPRNYDIKKVKMYLKKIKDFNIDGIIVSNLGILKLVKEFINIPIHISTQANVTDIVSANMWEQLGAERIILARELTYEEINNFCKNANPDIEVFIHGAMCMAYSGRCLMSKYMTGRDANRGDCAHPCRWKYYVREEKRKDELFEITEDENGMYIFNSKDLMLWNYIEKFIDIGVKSLKIEGRIKGILYLTTIVRSYRLLIDAIYNNEKIDDRWEEIIYETNNREYHEGFINGADSFESNLNSSRTFGSHRLLGYLDENKIFIAKAPFEKDEKYEFFEPGIKEGYVRIEKIIDMDNNEVNKAHPGQKYQVKFSKDLKGFSVLRYER